ncbi:MAG: hypothetical protein PVS3B3_04290 [Ktedonobacteraceae bacterium]
MSERQVATLPLQGKRVLVTRTREQASVLSEGLRTLGALPVEFPTIRIVPPSDWTRLDAALKRLYPSDSAKKVSNASSYIYDWLVFTSANGVHICLQRLQQLGYEPHMIQRIRIATIGPATADALTAYGLIADVIPDAYVAEGVAEAIIEDAQQRGIVLNGQHILLARAAEARKVLAIMLREAGAIVDDVPAYYTLTAAFDDEQGRSLWNMLQQRQLDIITFASSSTVRNFMAWVKQCEEATGVTLMPASLPTIACIGPITSQTARELGLTVAIEAKEFTIDGLLEAIVNYKEKLS